MEFKYNCSGYACYWYDLENNFLRVLVALAATFTLVTVGRVLFALVARFCRRRPTPKTTPTRVRDGDQPPVATQTPPVSRASSPVRQLKRSQSSDAYATNRRAQKLPQLRLRGSTGSSKLGEARAYFANAFKFISKHDKDD